MGSNNGGTNGLIDDYIIWMHAAGRGPLTIQTRAGQARNLCNALDVATCTERDLLRYLANDHWKPATRASARAGVRVFMEWLVRSGVRPDNPATDLPPVSVPPPCPHPASEATVAQARLSAADPWERLMVELAARAGLRRAEIATLRFSDVMTDPDGGYVLRITGKGGRTRMVPIPQELAVAIADLHTDWVFPSRYPGQHANPNHVGQVLSRLLGPGVTGHALRHRYATRVYSASHDLLAVQQLLGHSTPTTTQGYVRIDMDDLRKAAGAAS